MHILKTSIKKTHKQNKIKHWEKSKTNNVSTESKKNIFSRITLNRVFTLPDYRNSRELLKSSGIIDLQNNRVCKEFKH